jgi:hypothetical protein
VHVFQGEEHPLWNETTQKFGPMIDYFILNCSDPENLKFAKETLKVKSLPVLRFFPLGTSKKQTSTYSFGKDFDLKAIIRDVSELVEDNSLPIDVKSLQFQLVPSIQQGFAVVIMFHEQPQVSLGYRVLSSLSTYTGKFKFLNFRNPPADIKTQFGIK